MGGFFADLSIFDRRTILLTDNLITLPKLQISASYEKKFRVFEISTLLLDIINFFFGVKNIFLWIFLTVVIMIIGSLDQSRDQNHNEPCVI